VIAYRSVLNLYARNPQPARTVYANGEQPEEHNMTKRLLAGVAAAILMSGVAFAQSGPGSSTTTTTKQGTDWNGNTETKKDTYKEGASGSSDTHSKTTTEPSSGSTTTRSTTTTNPR
jgi:hypothetical protein